jgi:hypothetical protein
MLAHIRSIALGHAESEPELQAEQARVEEFTNLSLDQGMPRCI